MAVIVKLDVAATVGVPVIAPVAVFRLSPAGNEPVDTANVFAPVPPVVDTV